MRRAVIERACCTGQALLRNLIPKVGSAACHTVGAGVVGQCSWAHTSFGVLVVKLVAHTGCVGYNNSHDAGVAADVEAKP